jgi:DNA-binding response OmpR family regulator
LKNRDRLKILIVESDRKSAAHLRRLVSRLGHEPMVATTAAGAVALASLDRYHVLICSLQLSDGSGYALFRQVAAMYPVRGIALIGQEDQSDLQTTCRDAGFTEIIHTPMTFDTLRPAIAALS